MRILNPLLVTGIVLVASQLTVVFGQAVNNCEVRATVEVDESQAIHNDAKAVIKVQEGTAPFKYIFYEELTGKLLQKNFEKGRVDNLKKGTYYCIVIDNKGCSKKIQFQIQ